MRMWMPESPRWLMTHGRAREAEAVVADIEARLPPPAMSSRQGELPRVRLRSRALDTPLGEVVRTLFRAYRQRTLVGLSLMASQAFFYNAIFFTYALILTDFYGIRCATASAGTCCRSRPAISSGRCCSAACSTRSGAGR